MALDHFHPVIAEWFRSRFGGPTDVQTASWPAIVSGTHALIAAPTGSGKTLAAFLTCIDSLFKQALTCELDDHVQVVYVSPLKALSNDIQKNLQEPLAEIGERALSAGLLMPALRVEVRTGDTPQNVRQQILRRPPHILITTPESLFLLLTARKGRDILHTVRTVIVDEIHALASNKRGTHLALSLERLEALCAVRPVRIGLSATQRPLEEIARFLVGNRAPSPNHSAETDIFGKCHIVDKGRRRELDLLVEIPKDELGAVATNAIWADIYDRVADLVRDHRSTLVFVNTRRLAERVAHHLSERLGEDAVTAHHGSLSKKIRISAEDRLKKGECRAVVATASLELGIDIGHVDLVCQIGSPRTIATCIQRVGRSGHWVGAIPKGRLFCTTRDELVECAAVIHAIHQGNLDPVAIPSKPSDILAQQIVAEVAGREWAEDELYGLCTRAYPYRDLSRREFDAVVQMLTEGYVPGRRRQQAYVFHDRIQHRFRPRRGARLAALTSGGAIPDTATYAVVSQPEGTVVGTVDEDFAVESLAGDIILLGTSSWRIRGVETGKMWVEDAHGAPPTIPFWRGEAPSRTAELSAEVALVREQVSQLLDQGMIDGDGEARTWLQTHCGLDPGGVDQFLAYVAAGKRVLGAVPTQKRIIAERFFDEAGGMQLVIHAPFGGRVNKAWGLALRKRFCLNFDFELQAAATDDGLVLSLGEKHSFPLDAIFQFLRADTVQEVLVQALLGTPMFLSRWRWNASRALALLRFQKGKRVPLHLQRMRAEDLLSAAFPMATACQDNHVGDIQVPDHPLVTETIQDCLTDAMDVEGLAEILRQMERGNMHCLSVESPAPSPFAHEILNANPYAFLDDAPLEERRARAVNLRQVLPPDLAGKVGALDPEAIATVVEDAWPIVRDADELHEALHLLVWVPELQGGNWEEFLPLLVDSGRGLVVAVPGCGDSNGKPVNGWVTTEHFPLLQKIFPEIEVVSGVSRHVDESAVQSADGERETVVELIVQGWMESVGPVTVDELAQKLAVPPTWVQTAFLRLESQGQVLRGAFRVSSGAKSSEPADVEWCHRRLLARIHRRTVGTLRREIEPVSAAEFMRFLFRWQHRAHGTQLHGEAGLREIVSQLGGFELPASAWEPYLLQERVSNYTAETLDTLCLRGIVTWGRLMPPHRAQGDLSGTSPRRITPTNLAPISIFLREDGPCLAWIARSGVGSRQPCLHAALSSVAQDLLKFLQARGASFFTDLTGGTQHLAAEVEQGLWELVAAGHVTADGFDNLRALLDPRRRRAEGKERARRPRHSAGRWSLFLPVGDHQERERRGETHHKEWWARQLLRRYGVVFRDLLKRESMPMTWRELAGQYRLLEWRGEIRGGRFVSGFTGEQFALSEAVEALRAVRRDPQAGAQEIRVSAADPLNLVGIILPGSRIAIHPSNEVLFQNGMPVENVLDHSLPVSC